LCLDISTSSVVVQTEKNPRIPVLLMGSIALSRSLWPCTSSNTSSFHVNSIDARRSIFEITPHLRTSHMVTLTDRFDRHRRITFTQVFIVSEIHFSRDNVIKPQIRTNPEFRVADISAGELLISKTRISHRSHSTATKRRNWSSLGAMIAWDIFN